MDVDAAPGSAAPPALPTDPALLVVAGMQPLESLEPGKPERPPPPPPPPGAEQQHATFAAPPLLPEATAGGVEDPEVTRVRLLRGRVDEIRAEMSAAQAEALRQKVDMDARRERAARTLAQEPGEYQADYLMALREEIQRREREWERLKQLRKELDEMVSKELNRRA